MKEIRSRILDLVAKAEAAIPATLLPDLPPARYTSGAPEWHGFEDVVWQQGEVIRQLLVECKSLRKDAGLQSAFLRVACNRKAKRGRQSFIMLLGYSCCSGSAPAIAGQLSDPDVAGHVVDTLTKMRCPDFVQDVEELTNSDTTWVRNKAKRYVERYRSR